MILVVRLFMILSILYSNDEITPVTSTDLDSQTIAIFDNFFVKKIKQKTY